MLEVDEQLGGPQCEYPQEDRQNEGRDDPCVRCHSLCERHDANSLPQNVPTTAIAFGSVSIPVLTISVIMSAATSYGEHKSVFTHYTSTKKPDLPANSESCTGYHVALRRQRRLSALPWKAPTHLQKSPAQLSVRCQNRPWEFRSTEGPEVLSSQKIEA